MNLQRWKWSCQPWYNQNFIVMSFQRSTKSLRTSLKWVAHFIRMVLLRIKFVSKSIIMMKKRWNLKDPLNQLVSGKMLTEGKNLMLLIRINKKTRKKMNLQIRSLRLTRSITQVRSSQKEGRKELFLRSTLRIISKFSKKLLTFEIIIENMLL